MNQAARHQRNRDRLLQLHPGFAARVAAVIDELQGEGWRPRIQDAWRSAAQQEAAFAAGHSLLKFGFHNLSAADGRPEALAVDMLDDDSPLNPGKAYLLRLAAAAHNAGLTSGIRWGLSKRLAQAIDSAIADREWHAPVKIGWDPTHLEPLGLTVAQARAGLRPDFVSLPAVQVGQGFGSTLGSTLDLGLGLGLAQHPTSPRRRGNR